MNINKDENIGRKKNKITLKMHDKNCTLKQNYKDITLIDHLIII